MRRLGLVFGLVMAMQVAPAVAQQEPDLVYFESGQDAITPQAMERLRGVAVRYKAQDYAFVQVIGHTSRLGSEDSNEELSRRRAEKVRDVLVGFGVPGDRVITIAFGETVPAEWTPDGVAEPRNDRVQISIHPGSGW
jgi:outer membrane protein OmpA-like peptidoglycan-associated protein